MLKIIDFTSRNKFVFCDVDLVFFNDLYNVCICEIDYLKNHITCVNILKKIIDFLFVFI